MTKTNHCDCESKWERLNDEELRAAYRHLNAHLTAELCKLNLHLQGFVERRLVAEAVEGRTPRSEEGFRLGESMIRIGSVLVVDSRKRGAESAKANARLGEFGSNGKD